MLSASLISHSGALFVLLGLLASLFHFVFGTVQDLSVLQPKILARALTVLREMAIYPKLINTDYSPDPQQKGSTVTISMSNKLGVYDIQPGTDPDGAGLTGSKADAITLTLDRWKGSGFKLTEKDLVEVDANALFTPNAITEAVRALANEVNADVAKLYKGVPGLIGAPGTTPFASDLKLLTAARKQLNKQKAPRGVGIRAVVLDEDAYGQALDIVSVFLNSGDPSIQRDGEIGPRAGFSALASTTEVQQHIAGTAAGATVTLISNSLVGDKTITLKVSTSTATLVVGDVITITGDPQNYVVLAPATLDSTGVAVSIQGYRAIDGLAKAANGSSTPVAITVAHDHVVNLAFHREAFALAMRPSIFTPDSMPGGTRSMVMTDSVSGIPLRLDIIPGRHQTEYELSLLWGVKCVRPEYAVRIAG